MVLIAKVVLSTLALLPFLGFIEKRLGQHWCVNLKSDHYDKEIVSCIVLCLIGRKCI